jgi:hypothetical protein
MRRKRNGPRSVTRRRDVSENGAFRPMKTTTPAKPMGLVVAPPSSPTLKEYGTAGAWFFRNDPTGWVTRHVETLEILHSHAAIRRMTIDFTLPTDPATWISNDDVEATYGIPLARLAKERPTSFIDLRDEEGRVLPLMTRAENAVISRRALTVAVQALLGRQAVIDATLGYALDLLVDEEGITSELAAAIYERAASVRNQLRQGSAAGRLSQVVTQLQANSMIWVPLRGQPGQRRVLKLAYRLPLRVPVVPQRHTRLVKVEELDISILEERGIDTLASVRNLASRMTARMGFNAINITVIDPVMEDPSSYHFQVLTPSGVHLEEIVPTPFQTTDDAELFIGEQHLYLKSARSGQTMSLLLRFRVHRHGLLSLSLLATTVITPLLWLVMTNEPAILGGGAHVTRAQIAAAVLVLLPAGLAAFAHRPSENPLATVLLSGVRWFVVLSALCGAAAAAALGGIRATSSLHMSLLVYAVISTVCSVGTLVAWAGSFTPMRERALDTRRMLWGDYRYRSHRLTLAGICIALNGLAAFEASDETLFRPHHVGLAMIMVSVIGAATAAVAYLARRAPVRSKDLPGVLESNEDDPGSKPHPTDSQLLSVQVPYIPWAMYGATILCAVAGALDALLLGSGGESALPALAVICIVAAGLFASAVAINLLQPLGERPGLSYLRDPSNAAEVSLENLDLLENDLAAR